MLGELRIGLPDRPAQRRVDRVDRAVALGGEHVTFLTDPHLDGRLGVELAGADLVGDDAHRLDLEEVLLPTGRTAHQQLERRVGGLEVVALVLEPLEFVDDLH